ncbi:acyl carrier protein [Pseudonocardia broussonetiae]|uniref:Acyl carrier protein n=1 Tax=Pseudonocardia broussonetiae TaxID=2736640 RepID=A0A6M6JDT3_9PSEU|nr:acyl carrier protein [Pseudonocardia broussonetiae]QJY45726.1 acyl carrier protein [Pseudonocardia broussonetiae]
MNGETQPFLEEILVAYAAVLLAEDIHPRATFADLGGTSLTAAIVLARLWRVLGVRLALTDLGAGVTAAELAALVAERAGGPPADRSVTR